MTHMVWPGRRGTANLPLMKGETMLQQDSTLVSLLNKIADMVILSVLWCLCTLPVFTAGAACAALYHTIVKVIRQGRGYAFSTFRDSFRSNFRQSLPPTLLLTAGFLTFGCTCYVCWQNPDSMIAGMYVIFSVLCLLLLLIAWIHIFPLIGRFRLKRQELFTLIVRLSFAHPARNFLLLCMLLFALELAIYYPPLLFIVPSGLFWLASQLQEPMFRRHINYDEDPLP